MNEEVSRHRDYNGQQSLKGEDPSPATETSDVIHVPFCIDSYPSQVSSKVPARDAALKNRDVRWCCSSPRFHVHR